MTTSFQHKGIGDLFEVKFKIGEIGYYNSLMGVKDRVTVYDPNGCTAGPAIYIYKMSPHYKVKPSEYRKLIKKSWNNRKITGRYPNYTAEPITGSTNLNFYHIG